jgi:hypothetical protein
MQYRQTVVVLRFTLGIAKMLVARRHLLICFVACFIAAGCGKGKPASTVSGKVTLAGQPLEEGAITFFSSTGSTGTSEIGAGGSYSLMGPNKEEGVVPGRYTAIVMPSMAQIKKTHNDPRIRVKDSSIPIKYTSAASSPLKYDVAVGPNTIDILLDGESPSDK